MSILILFLAGAAGSLSKDIIQDGRLTLPKKDGPDLVLGFLGGVIAGGVSGCIVDHSPLTAFLAGYAGTSAIENLLTATKVEESNEFEINEKIIRKIAKEQGVDPDLAVRVANCESGLKAFAKHSNQDGSIDRGLYQINTKYHPEVSDEQAYNPITATEFFCKAFKGGNLGWWNASKTCWDK
jgi:hypothetical protein